MSHLSLTDSVLVAQDISDQIISSAVNGTVFDMQGWDGICYLFNIGTMAAGATFDARIMSSANSNFSGNSNVANAALTQVANTSNTSLSIIDVYRPSDRYLKSVTTPATANVTFGSIAIRYRRSGVLPPTAPATTLQTVKVAAN